MLVASPIHCFNHHTNTRLAYLLSMRDKMVLRKEHDQEKGSLQLQHLSQIEKMRQQRSNILAYLFHEACSASITIDPA